VLREASPRGSELLFIERASKEGDPWSGHMAFPGGRAEPLDPNLRSTAERETFDMFGIDFAGNPNLSPIYLPEGFIGHPLLKSYPLLSREVKPWPGDVDVEDMPEDEDQGADA